MPKLSSMIECNPIRNILVMLYGNSKPDMMRYNLPLWFLPCLLITMMFDGIETIVRKYGRAMRYFAIAAFAVAGVFFSMHENVALPWHTETACSMAVWFISGISVQETKVIEKIIR